MIRTPYIKYYRNPLDNLPCKLHCCPGPPARFAISCLLTKSPHPAVHVGNIVLWSNIETAIGLIAGSLPSLRFLVVRNIKSSRNGNSTGPSYGQKSRDRNLVTIGGGGPASHGGGKRHGSFKNPNDTNVTVSNVYGYGEGDWERLSDTSSQAKLKNATSEEINHGGIRADFSVQVELSEWPENRRV